MKDIYLGRQPIYDSAFRVEGYELLHHPTDAENTALLDSELASSQALFDTLTEVGLERLVGPGKAFINVARDLIVQGHLEQVIAPSPRLIFQVNADIVVDAPLADALRALRQQGYRFLSDDVTTNVSQPSAMDWPSVWMGEWISRGGIGWAG